MITFKISTQEQNSQSSTKSISSFLGQNFAGFSKNRFAVCGIFIGFQQRMANFPYIASTLGIVNYDVRVYSLCNKSTMRQICLFLNNLTFNKKT